MKKMFNRAGILKQISDLEVAIINHIHLQDVLDSIEIKLTLPEQTNQMKGIGGNSNKLNFKKAF